MKFGANCSRYYIIHGEAARAAQAARRSVHRGMQQGRAGAAPGAHYRPRVRLLMSSMNSVRVRESSRKEPSMALVTVLLFCFCTPRMTMQ